LLNKRGFTISEGLLVVAIISLLIGSVLYILIAAQSSMHISSAKAELQSEVRRAMDWIVNDVRQTVNWSIGSNANNPSSTHIKFKKVTGYSTEESGSAVLSGFVEYSYDPSTNIITRFDADANRSWVFRNIMQAPFYTRLPDGSIVVIDPVISGNDSPVFTTGNLVIVIKGQKEAQGAPSISYTLTQEVKIRN
jgi:type II secretory pathway pseudopilin PulG